MNRALRPMLLGGVLLGLAGPAPAASPADRTVGRLTAAIRLLDRAPWATAIAARLVARTRSRPPLSQARLLALSRSLDRLYARSRDLRATHEMLTRAGLIDRLRRLGLDSGQVAAKGPLGHAIKEPLPHLAYDPARVHAGITVDGRWQRLPIEPLDVDVVFHWSRDHASARRVVRQGFALSDIWQEGGRGMFTGPDPARWRIMGRALLRIDLDRRGVRMLDWRRPEAHAVYRAWATARGLDADRREGLERFFGAFGVDVLKKDVDEYLIKSGRAIRRVRRLGSGRAAEPRASTGHPPERRTKN